MMRVIFEKSLYIYFAILLLLLPFRLLAALIFSIAVHEMFHIAAIQIMEIHIYSVRVGIRGTYIETERMTAKQECISALAGPFGGLLLLLLFRWAPVLSLISAIHSLYNLLPIYPSDGGRAFRNVVRFAIHGNTAEMLIYAAEVIVLSFITAISVFGMVYFHFGILPAVFAGSMIVRWAERK